MNTTQKLSFQKVYNRIKREVNFITQSSLVNFRDEIRADAQRIVLELKPEIENWIERLKEKELSCAELYCYIQQKRDVIEIRGLNDKNLSENEIALVKNALLQLISNTIINTYLSSLFDKPCISDKAPSVKNDTIFF
jgi:hypothetical protein